MVANRKTKALFFQEIIQKAVKTRWIINKIGNPKANKLSNDVKLGGMYELRNVANKTNTTAKCRIKTRILRIFILLNSEFIFIPNLSQNEANYGAANVGKVCNPAHVSRKT